MVCTSALCVIASQNKVAVNECTLTDQRTDITLKERKINELGQTLAEKEEEITRLTASIASMNAAAVRYQQEIAERAEKVASLENVLSTYQ